MNDYHHGHLKQQLLDEGLKLLIEDGYKNFSMRKLARRCNVSHTSPYRHFADKEKLIKALSVEVHEKFNTSLKESMDQVEGSPVDKLKGMGKGYVKFFMKNPDYLELLFLTPELYNMENRKDDCGDGSSFLTYFSAVSRALNGNGTVDLTLPEGPSVLKKPEAIPGAALQPWCLIHGLTVLLVKKAIPVSSPEDVDRLIEQILETV
jgi:AcrR family transcriptional regulator